MTKTYSGSCHCGQVRFEVTADLAEAGECNCSICNRVGWIIKMVAPSEFKLLAGEDAQTDYQFGKKTMHHLFCSTCGIHAFGRYQVGDREQEKVLVNLRCLEGIELEAVKVAKFDGKSY